MKSDLEYLKEALEHSKKVAATGNISQEVIDRSYMVIDHIIGTAIEKKAEDEKKNKIKKKD